MSPTLHQFHIRVPDTAFKRGRVLNQHTIFSSSSSFNRISEAMSATMDFLLDPVLFLPPRDTRLPGRRLFLRSGMPGAWLRAFGSGVDGSGVAGGPAVDEPESLSGEIVAAASVVVLPDEDIVLYRYCGRLLLAV